MTLTIPDFVLGCMYFGTRIDRKTSFDLIDVYRESGRTMLDTANNYAFWIDGSLGGESELLIGDYLRDRGCRHELTIATKIGACPLTPDGYPDNLEGLRPDRVAPAVNGCLERLGVHEIDLLYAHVDDQSVPLEESMGALADMVDAGKVRAIGLSNFTATRLAAAIGVLTERKQKIAALQEWYSVLLPRPEVDLAPQAFATDAVLDQVRQHDIPVIAYSPMIEGTLAKTALVDTFDTEDNRVAIVELKAEARSRGIGVHQLVAALIRAMGARMLVGSSSVDQLRASLAAAEIPITSEDVRRLSRVTPVVG